VECSPELAPLTVQPGGACYSKRDRPGEPAGVMQNRRSIRTDWSTSDRSRPRLGGYGRQDMASGNSGGGERIRTAGLCRANAFQGVIRGETAVLVVSGSRRFQEFLWRDAGRTRDQIDFGIPPQSGSLTHDEADLTGSPPPPTALVGRSAGRTVCSSTPDELAVESLPPRWSSVCSP
jgi:hypothetical protein